MQSVYLVAETIGCQVYDIEENMSPDEFAGWLAYLEFKAEQEKKAAEKARKKR
ncbi:hypothetical protein M316_0124 [Nitrincola phage 1M3-16]|uniref:hypothetical protein n=1 Tax=Nitrincola phage 1M3-16 TaxID=1472912 RepID=UPI000444E63E|nr:hypothetical protein GJ22_gp028 [Nitrincola phage 1M3-16]AHX01189.1 hypothetical protein M316_0124 [Nitrincola phage 1M3-16]